MSSREVKMAPDEKTQQTILIVDDVLLPLYEKVKERTRVERVLVVPISGKPVRIRIVDIPQDKDS